MVGFSILAALAATPHSASAESGKSTTVPKGGSLGIGQEVSYQLPNPAGVQFGPSLMNSEGGMRFDDLGQRRKYSVVVEPEDLRRDMSKLATPARFQLSVGGRF